MKKIGRWIMLVAVASPTLFGMSCATNLRDAAWAGAMDFVQGYATDALNTYVPPAGGEEVE